VINPSGSNSPTLRERIKSRELLFGIMSHSGSPQVIEIAGLRGFDFVLIDTEHSDGTDETRALTLIRAANSVGLPTIVRVRANDAWRAQQLLDYGADGICFPHVNTKEDAIRAVASTKYAPEGNRGMCPHVRASGYCGRAEWSRFWPQANKDTITMVLVEDENGVKNFADIAAVPGVDIAGIGAGDLSQYYGDTDGWDKGAVPRVAKIQAEANAISIEKGVGSFVPLAARGSEDSVREWIDRGARFFVWPDTAVINEALKELAQLGAAARASLTESASKI
jgi:4-hydroxy-2-oxoheptanedioate aldolase